MTRPPARRPSAQGLYDPSQEHDACGVGFVVNIKGVRSHKLVEQAFEVAVNLLHRGACGCERNTGDGAGLLLQVPDKFLRRETAALGFRLPPAGEYGVGMLFLPRPANEQIRVEERVVRIVLEEGQHVLGWREVPTDDSALGETARQGHALKCFRRDAEAAQHDLLAAGVCRLTEPRNASPSIAGGPPGSAASTAPSRFLQRRR